jgi:sialic acid synthase SpsE
MAGACIIEKHLTYDRNAAGPDHSASADPQQFQHYVQRIRKAQQMLGDCGKRVLPCEADVRSVSRQSVVLTRDLQAGERIDETVLRIQRPGVGIPAADMPRTIGRRTRQPLSAGTVLTWDMLSDAA